MSDAGIIAELARMMKDDPVQVIVLLSSMQVDGEHIGHDELARRLADVGAILQAKGVGGIRASRYVACEIYPELARVINPGPGVNQHDTAAGKAAKRRRRVIMGEGV